MVFFLSITYLGFLISCSNNGNKTGKNDSVDINNSNLISGNQVNEGDTSEQKTLLEDQLCAMYITQDQFNSKLLPHLSGSGQMGKLSLQFAVDPTGGALTLAVWPFKNPNYLQTRPHAPTQNEQVLYFTRIPMKWTLSVSSGDVLGGQKINHQSLSKLFPP
jgi:hypothetical protein